jgi:4'-phosphopantetheinyl transferase EntD
VRTGCRAIMATDVPALHDVEAEAVARAVAQRRSEFASGRVLLRDLLEEDVTIPVLADRRPGLPDDVVGSLAHDREVAVAAIAGRAVASAVGIDIEPATPLDAAMAATILRSDEHGLDPHLVFTLKEAAYKAWSSGGGELLDHHEVRVTLNSARGSFVAIVTAGRGRFAGRFTRASGRWLALVVVDAAPGRFVNLPIT